MSQKLADNKLSIIARSPFNLYYEGPGESLSATNRVGKFDILPGHADFFSILTPGEIIIETESKPVVIDADNGILTVRDNQVMLFVNM
jgi:F0F1-type ATP synthase epsilon subunit